MRLFIFLWNFQLGGVQKHTVYLANELADKGVEITILFNKKEGILLSSLNMSIDLKYFSVPNTNNLLKLVQLERALSKLIPKGSNILCNGPNNFRQLSRINKFGRKWNLLYVLHNDFTFSHNIMGKLNLLEMKWLCASGRAQIIALSRKQRETHQRLLETHSLKVIPNFIKLPISPLSNQPSKKLKAVVIGRYSAEKGMEDLIMAIKLSDVQLDIDVFGNGSNYKNHISEYARKEQVGCICFKDEVRNPFDILSNYRFLILPSKRETFGLVLIEAMSCGLPVVSTDCDGPLDIINEENGIVVKRNDPRSLANGIDVMVNKIKQGFFDSEKIKKSAEKYSVEKVANQYLDLFIE